MLITNIQNNNEYFYNLLEFLVNRNKEDFTPKQFEKLLSIENYLYFLEALPKEEQAHIIKQLLELIRKYNYDDEYKHYQGKDINNGNSPSKQIIRDTSKIIVYEELLKELYSDYMLTTESDKVYLINAPKELKEHFYFIEQLKKNMNKKNTIENKNYYKPLEPDKKIFKLFLIEVREHYKIKISNTDIKNFIKDVI